MSRRLAISSLLCDDDQPAEEPRIIPEPVVLAPHLRRSPPALPSVGLNALAVAAAEERSKFPAASSSWHNPYPFSPEHLQQRQHQQLEQRHVHREQILGYNSTEHPRPGRKSDPLPGPGMRTILSPTVPVHFDEPSHKKRRYSDEYELMRQQEDADRYRRQEEERLLARRVQQESDDFRQRSGRRAGYDPVHNDHHPYPQTILIPEREPERPPQYPYPRPYLPSPPPHVHQHRVISPPVGRRSPPGSQAGRAIAAKHTPQVIIKKEEEEELRKRKPSPRQSIPPPPLPTPPPPPIHPQTLEEDPHEWLLEHYTDDDRRKIKRPHSSAAPSSAVTPALPSARSDPGRRSSTSPVARKATKSPVLSGDDPMTALEQELDAELAQVVVDPDAMDVDVDKAVAQLVDETLDAPTPKVDVVAEKDDDHKAMQVDVEDELLSLLDDRPNSRMSVSTPNPVPVPDTKPPKAPPAVQQLKHEETTSRSSSPLTLSATSPFRPSSASGVRQSSAKPSEKDDRESMPPPSTPKEVTVTAPQPKKRGKPGPKPKPRNPDGTIVGAPPPPPPKPRGKPGPKPKPRDEYGNIIRTSAAATTPAASASAPSKGGSRASSSATPAPAQISRTVSGSAARASSSSGVRSRSTSAHPAGSVGPEGDTQAKEEENVEEKEKEEEDDKLYCLCKTKYNEDKPMIACDSCDEWYHMKCVQIPEHKGDLVDQFFCPTCISKNPTQNLQTSYKARCLFGLNSPDPDSPKACHKPVRTFSKYCSEECGVKTLRKKIDTFTKKGGKKEDLWESVKSASKREGLVRVIEPAPTNPLQVVGGGGDALVAETASIPTPVIIKEIQPTKTKQEREIERLNGLLADIEQIRDELRRGMDIILSREKLLQLASDRSESLGQCGWDQRLCFSDEDWADYGEGVLESYAELDESNREEAEWWCPGDQDCERHNGWQSLRAKDVDKEKEKKEEALFRLTSREREIRKRIDRIEEQDSVGPLLGNAPRRNGAGPQKGSAKLSNGHSTKPKVNGDAPKKGKKRKVPS